MSKKLLPEKLSSEQMQRYLSGEMTDAEQHQIESYLLENQPETEALEGLHKIKNPKVLENDLNEIQKRIRARIKEDRKIPVMAPKVWQFNPMNIAVAACVAVLLLVATSLFVLNYFAKKNENQSVVAQNQVVPPVTDSNTPSTADKENKETEKPEETKVIPKPTYENKPFIAENKPVLKDETEKLSPTQPEVLSDSKQNSTSQTPDSQELAKKEPVAKESEVFAEEDRKEADVSKVESKREEVPKTAFKEKDNRNAKKMQITTDKNVPLQVLKGSVKDESGNPLPGVNVYVKGSREGVVTDAEGNYEIEVAENSILIYSFIGYTTLETQVVDSKKTLNTSLSPDVQALNEVVVVAYGSDENKNATERFFTTEPTLGYSKYKQYITANIQYPQAALENHIEGNVVVSFVVNPDRNLSDFKVRRSLGYGCDEEAIRLIQNGPKWNPALREGQPVKQRIRMKIRFKMK